MYIQICTVEKIKSSYLVTNFKQLEFVEQILGTKLKKATSFPKIIIKNVQTGVCKENVSFKNDDQLTTSNGLI